MTKKVRTIHLNNRIIITAYTAPSIPADKLRCRHKGGHSSLAQKKYNRKKSLERIVYKAINSFTKGCFHIIYTYNDDSLPADADTAYRDLVNAFRGTKRLYKKHDISCPYIGSVEHGDKKGRLHCHALFPYTRDLDIEEIKSKWKKGTVLVFYIPVNQIEAKVMYVLKEPVKKIISKSFNMPKEEVKDITESEFKELINNPLSVEDKIPGFVVSGIEEFNSICSIAGFHKIRIQLREVTSDNYANKLVFCRKEWELPLNTA